MCIRDRTRAYEVPQAAYHGDIEALRQFILTGHDPLEAVSPYHIGLRVCYAMSATGLRDATTTTPLALRARYALSAALRNQMHCSGVSVQFASSCL
eukprot:123435-Rhodomonas_salina.1